MVEAEGLGKDYRGQAGWRDLLRGRLRGPARAALDGVDLRIGAGEVVAVMGDNGAGKSTLCKVLGGLVSPTRGRGSVAGVDVATGGPALRRVASYVGGDARSFAWRLSGRENLAFFARLHGLARGEIAARVAHVLAQVRLEPDADRPVAEYSTGMRQRLSLARGLLGAPRLWLLDEPTSGLDPAAARGVRALVRELAAGGAAVLLCTHLVEDARSLAGRVVVLRGGRVIYSGDAAGAEAALG